MNSINVKNICILFVIISSVVFTTSFILNTSYADEGCDELDLQCRQENWNDSGPEIHKSDTVPESTVDDKTSRSNTDNSFEDWLIALIVIIIIILLGIILVIFRKKHPTPPQNLTATIPDAQNNPLVVSLTWDEPSDWGSGTPTSYDLLEDVGSTGSFTTVASALPYVAGQFTHSHTITTVTPLTDFDYKVVANTPHGTSTDSNVDQVTTVNVPSSPTNVTNTIDDPDNNPYEIKVQWSAGFDATNTTGYKIERFDDNTNAWSVIVADTGNTATTYTETVPSLVNTQFKYRISQINIFGTSAVSVESNAVTTPDPSRKFFTSERLDSDQEAAVQYRYDKPLIVRAGPGAGKTRVVKERIKDIILEQDRSENRILCLSFSKAAQFTMIDRFKDDVDLKGDFEEIIKNREKNKLAPLSKDEQEKMQKCIRNISIGEYNIRTIHSLGNKISGSKKVIEDDQLKKFHDEILETDYPIISMKHPVGTGFPDFKERLKDAVSAWKKERAMLDKLSKYIDDLKSQKPEKIDKEKEIAAKIAQYKELEKYFDSYESFLHSKSRIDFDDMVLDAITTLEENPEQLKEWQKQYDHIIIDEFQDNNSLQTQLAKLLSPKGHITVIGDEDQCIYTFQGAHVENFRNFKDDYKKFNPEEKILRTNYRSTEEIVEKSQKLMNAERDRLPKNLRAFEGNGKGSTPELHEFDTSKAEFSFIRDKINELKKSVPLEDFVVLFRKNKETNDFIKFLKSSKINVRIKNKGKGVWVSTIHGVKGQEKPIVFTSHIETGSIPTNLQEAELQVPAKFRQINLCADESIEHKKEERRVFYVAMTRAMKQLFLTYHIDKSTSRSEFLNDLHLTPKIHKSTSEEQPDEEQKMIDEPTPEPEGLRQSYDILEIKETSTKGQIKEAYRKKILFYHPDKFRNDFASRIAWAEEKTKRIIEAYEKLKDAGKED